MPAAAFASVSGRPPISFPNLAACTRNRRRTITDFRLQLLVSSSSSSSASSADDEVNALTCCCPSCGNGGGRRRLILGASAAAAAALLPPVPLSHSMPLDLISVFGSCDEPTVTIEKYHPRRPDWYEELFASEMEQGMRTYEAEIAAYKEKLFTDHVKGKCKKVLELGVGTGPNFKYYASAADLDVIGLDPNKKMEKYARAAAKAAGLPSTNFNFIKGVGEALILGDETIDAVIGTLVLCSVKDVEMTLREVKRVLKPGGVYLFIEHVAAPDGSLLRLVQGILDPLQQLVADGCHLTRDIESRISEAGFSMVSLDAAFVSSASLISPHVYGVACK